MTNIYADSKAPILVTLTQNVLGLVSTLDELMMLCDHAGLRRVCVPVNGTLETTAYAAIREAAKQPALLLSLGEVIGQRYPNSEKARSSHRLIDSYISRGPAHPTNSQATVEVSDSYSTPQESAYAQRHRYRIHIEGEFSQLDDQKLVELIQLLRKASGNAMLKIERLTEGSILCDLECTEKELEDIVACLKSQSHPKFRAASSGIVELLAEQDDPLFDLLSTLCHTLQTKSVLRNAELREQQVMFVSGPQAAGVELFIYGLNRIAHLNDEQQIQTVVVPLRHVGYNSNNAGVVNFIELDGVASIGLKSPGLVIFDVRPISSAGHMRMEKDKIEAILRLNFHEMEHLLSRRHPVHLLFATDYGNKSSSVSWLKRFVEDLSKSNGFNFCEIQTLSRMRASELVALTRGTADFSVESTPGKSFSISGSRDDWIRLDVLKPLDSTGRRMLLDRWKSKGLLFEGDSTASA